MTASPVLQAHVLAPPIRVLFADDSPPIRTLARYALSAERGFSVMEAVDGAEALALFDQHHPDCVVLDVEMPGMGGMEALEQLQRHHPRTPVVMLSGYADRQVTDRAIAAGAAAYLDKGSELVLLAETIKRVTQAMDEPHGPSASERLEAQPVNAQASHQTDGDAAARDLKRLEYVVSHDLAEPARVMSGFATLLQTRYESALDERGQSFLEHIVDGAARMQSMIDDLLIYSRAAQLRSRGVVVDVASRVRGVTRQLDRRISASGAEVSTAALPTAVGDPDMISTIFRHLLLNALTFNTAAVPQVRIRGRINGWTASYTVQDNGIGVNAAQTDEVFELCRRLNTREEYPGNGVGLALCRRLVTLQGGALRLDAGDNGGSIVTLTLPATQGHQGEAA